MSRTKIFLLAGLFIVLAAAALAFVYRDRLMSSQSNVGVIPNKVVYSATGPVLADPILEPFVFPVDASIVSSAILEVPWQTAFKKLYVAEYMTAVPPGELASQYVTRLAKLGYEGAIPSVQNDVTTIAIASTKLNHSVTIEIQEENGKIRVDVTIDQFYR